MKGATMKMTMEQLGITASYSRPRIRNDNPFSEALLRTCKYRPDWPTKGFATKADAQVWVQSFASWYNNEHRPQFAGGSKVSMDGAYGKEQQSKQIFN
jgi:putative transposase